MKKTFFTLGASLFILAVSAQTIDMNNANLLDANKITINDIGSGEGIDWKSGRNISVYSTAQGGNDEFRFNTTNDYPFKFMGGRMSINDSGSLPNARLTVNGDINEEPFRVRLNGTTKFRISSSGNIHAGGNITTASAFFEIGGTSSSQDPFAVSKFGSNTTSFRVRSNGRVSINDDQVNLSSTRFVVNANSGEKPFRARVNKVTKFLIDTEGKVGIGTSTPSYLLDVNGALNLNKSISSGVALRVKGSEALWYNGTYFSWGYGGSWNYFKDRVGIGTSSPSSSYMLSVNGKIRAKEIRVETGWADYVFEKDYELRTLEEVEAFIAKNGHLPDVPSAEEVEANGIELGSMDATLLRKLEEITLYLIELKKENEELKSAIKK